MWKKVKEEGSLILTQIILALGIEEEEKNQAEGVDHVRIPTLHLDQDLDLLQFP